MNKKLLVASFSVILFACGQKETETANEKESESEIRNEITKFTCDDPELKKLIQEKVGRVQNVRTTYVDEDLQICNCEGYAPDKVYKYGNNPSDRQFGVGIEYKAQRKEDGTIEVEVLYQP